jgi:hypothetical protein
MKNSTKFAVYSVFLSCKVNRIVKESLQCDGWNKFERYFGDYVKSLNSWLRESMVGIAEAHFMTQ